MCLRCSKCCRCHRKNHRPSHSPLGSYDIGQGSANVSAEGSIVNILGFAGYTVSIATTQVCKSGAKVAINNIECECGCVPITFYLQGRPRGLAVKCARSNAGGPGSDPRRAPRHHFSVHPEAKSHIQQLEGCAAMTYNYLLGLWGEKINK